MNRHIRIALDPNAPCYGVKPRPRVYKPVYKPPPQKIETETPEPIVVPTAYGKHLATSPHHAMFRIGVIEVTSEGARQKFFQSYAKWRSYGFPPIDYQI